MTKENQLQKINEVVCNCTSCPLAEDRTNTVFGEGNPDATVMFIGEGPGKDEDESGRPFVGKAGRLLDNIITACGWKREDVYIANIVKCRPPGNRNPEEEEASQCLPYLKLQIKVVNPQYIVCLGAVASRYLLRNKSSVGTMRERWHSYSDSNVDAKVLVTYHPAYLLRNPSAKADVWEDMQLILGELEGTA